MVRRRKKELTAHNKKVSSLARKYKKNGWKIKADIKGYLKPSPIGKYKQIPDLEITKLGRIKLIEVETPSTITKDKKQQETFRKSAAQKKNTTFELIITK